MGLTQSERSGIVREIKFRGKRVDNGEWVHGFVEFHLVDGDLTKTKQTAFITYDSMDEIGKVYRDSFEVIPETVGQYTGLTDKNGKEIYEGDIVSFNCYSYDEPENSYFGEVVYSSGNACFCLNGYSNDGKEDYSPLCECSGSYTTIIEVLGNIFENPELLQETNV